MPKQDNKREAVFVYLDSADKARLKRIVKRAGELVQGRTVTLSEYVRVALLLAEENEDDVFRRLGAIASEL
jgi:hypothetical protein